VTSSLINILLHYTVPIARLVLLQYVHAHQKGWFISLKLA